MNEYAVERTPSDDERGYRVHIPRPLPMEPFSERYASMVTDTRPLCHIGIATAGYLIAGCGIVGRSLAGHNNDSLISLDARRPEMFDPAPNIPILVDNSVHEGTTLARVVGFLHRRFIRPAILLTLFDYDDDQEHAMRQWAGNALGMRVVSLFSHADLT